MFLQGIWMCPRRSGRWAQKWQHFRRAWIPRSLKAWSRLVRLCLTWMPPRAQHATIRLPWMSKQASSTTLPLSSLGSPRVAMLRSLQTSSPHPSCVSRISLKCPPRGLCLHTRRALSSRSSPILASRASPSCTEICFGLQTTCRSALKVLGHCLRHTRHNACRVPAPAHDTTLAAYPQLRTLHTAHSATHIMHCALCTMHCALCTVHCALCTVHCALCTVCVADVHHTVHKLTRRQHFAHRDRTAYASCLMPYTSPSTQHTIRHIAQTAH